jgi:hypothetical protein
MRVRGNWERLLRSGWEKQIPLRGMTERKATTRAKAKAKADSLEGNDRKKSKGKSGFFASLPRFAQKCKPDLGTTSEI